MSRIIFQMNIKITVGEIIRTNREKNGLLLRQLSALIDMDTAILSKIERGERKATKEQIVKIAEILNLNESEILIQYLSEKIAYQLLDEDLAVQTLKVAEEKINYLKSVKNGKI